MSLIGITIQTILFQLGSTYDCFQWGNCTLTGNLFNVAIMPYQWSLGVFAPVAIWGILILVIWQRSQSVMLVGIVGIVLNTLLISFYPPARQIGWFLLAIAIGTTLYWLFIIRPHGGSPS